MQGGDGGGGLTPDAAQPLTPPLRSRQRARAAGLMEADGWEEGGSRPPGSAG
jgi:hypothetical protein